MRRLRSPRPNYVLGAERPDVPHVECTDGFVWHPAEEKRHCLSGWVLDVPTILLATFYQGEPIERFLSLRSMLTDEAFPLSHDALMLRLFPACDRSQCDANGYYRSRWYRSAMAIHEDAIPYLREAKPPLRALLDPEVPLARRRVAVRSGKLDSHRLTGGLPICETLERTRDEQIAWCSELQEAG